MKKLLFLFVIIIPLKGFAQDMDILMDSLMNSDLFRNGIEFNVNLQVHVPGIHMPDKNIHVSIDSEGKAKIKGEGLLLLPQKGIFGQFVEFRKTPNQVIVLGNHADTLSYKIVSLDSNSDWITADVFINKKLKQISRMEITTRKFGTFKVSHHYSEHWYPDFSRIEFSALPIDLPFNVIGKSSQTDIDIKNDEEVSGIIVLTYSNVVKLK